MGNRKQDVATRQITAVNRHDDNVEIDWTSGGSTRFHYQWLRDNCRSPERFDTATRERKALTEEIPSDLRARSAQIDNGQLLITWSDGGGDSRFDPDWLHRNSYDPAPVPPEPAQETWGAEYAQALATFSYRDVFADDLVAATMIGEFERLGLVRLAGMPAVEGEVERFAERLAYVREIAFDRVADIAVSADPYTLGFTNAALPLHSDCSGYSWPPNVMVFHCLKNEVAGGASQYVDGARVVAELDRHEPDALRVLTTFDVEFRLWSRQADTLSRCPPITLDASGRLAILRYANWTVQPLVTVPFDMVPAWYDAWRSLARRINAPENRVTYRCQPGEALLINNHRVLHGRDAFDNGEGARHFQQVYMELDDLSGFRRIVENLGGAR
ncbi:MAG: TauD/TfdA family dioxygenase [Dermatophilaceae bacterium]